MSRAEILERIKKNKPELVPLPDLSVFRHDIPQEDLIKDFIKTSTGNMSTVVNIIGSKIPFETYLEKFIAENYPETVSIYKTSLTNDQPEQTDFTKIPVDLFIAEPQLGVAENGCLWVDDHLLKQRVSAFACQHTLFIVDHKNIVPTMHQAYQKIKINDTGFGVFIAGPSKTADIEQSLVVGAQGAVSNTIILI